MFQSSANLFSNSTTLQNIEHLQKIWKIPQDQLDLLKCIPGWSCEEEVIEKSTVQPITELRINRDTQSSSKHLTSKNIASQFSSNICLINTKQTDNVLFDNKYQTISSIARSSSLSSLNKLEETSNECKLRHSASVPNLNRDSLFILNSDCSDPVEMSNNYTTYHPSKEAFTKRLSLSSNRNVTEVTIPAFDLHGSKSQFTNSAVQCQMSQSSQPDLEIALSERIAHSSVSTFYKKNENIMNCQTDVTATQDPLQCKPITTAHVSDHHEFAVLETAPKSTPEISNNMTSKATKESSAFSMETCKINEINVTDVDESFVSLPIPCAQPLSSDSTLVSKYAPCTDQTYAPLILSGAIPSTSSKIGHDFSEKRNHHSAPKRKRKNKLEKVPKKFRGMETSKIRILYSSSQISKMIEIMKILNGL